MATDEQEKNRSMSMTPIFNIQDSIAESFREPVDTKPRKRTPSSSALSRKKFTEDVDTVQQPVDKPIKISVRKPLPTLKSLSKENKKLQRLLQISLAQRSQDPKSESVAAANIQLSDSSYNSSLGSEPAMNKSLAGDSQSSILGKESKQKPGSSRRLSRKPQANTSNAKKVENPRSQFFAQENVDLEESEPSSGAKEEGSG